MPRNQLIKSGLFLLLLLGLMVGGSWRANRIENPLFRGETMGTTYSIRLIGVLTKKEANRLAERMDALLLTINQQMSTWLEDSEISTFNRHQSTAPFPVSEEFALVTKSALALAAASDGAFDPTLQPLLNLWGFGSESRAGEPPSPAQIEEIRESTGWDKITVEMDAKLRKDLPDIQLALGAIAKGYAVDRLGELLREEAFEEWFIEVGGEVLVAGKNTDRVAWKIGIQSPDAQFFDTTLHGIVQATNGAVATSGSYRNYVEVEGKRYAHILDPQSGQAVYSDLVSVSVVAPSCLEADGWATALYVMDVESGLKKINELPTIEALFICSSNENLVAYYSDGFMEKTSYETTY